MCVASCAFRHVGCDVVENASEVVEVGGGGGGKADVNSAAASPRPRSGLTLSNCILTPACKWFLSLLHAGDMCFASFAWSLWHWRIR